MKRDQWNLPDEQPDTFLGDLARRILESDARWVIVGTIVASISVILLLLYFIEQ
jgi:hypothetical protein